MKNYRNRNLPDLREFRRKLRNNSTSAEAELWKLLKGKQLEGRKFRRQYSVGRYILDFYCVSERIGIELDGDPHGDYITIQKDEERDQYLINQGIKIIRFENRFVFQEPEMVIETIRATFNKEKHTTPTSLREVTPPDSGGEIFKC